MVPSPAPTAPVPTAIPAVPSAPTKTRIGLLPIRPAPKLPAILFEEDRVPLPGFHPAPSHVRPSGGPGVADAPEAGSRDVGQDGEFPGVESIPEAPPGESGVLPATYGTGSIWLAARDPFLVLAHWDFAAEQLAMAAAGWGPGGWQLRLHQGDVHGRRVMRRALPAASGEAFLPVNEAGCRYVVELGYETLSGKWFGVAMSAPATTPHELVAPAFGGPGPAAEAPAVAWAAPAPVVPDPDEPFGGVVEWLDAPASAPSMDAVFADSGMEFQETIPTPETPGTIPGRSWELARMVWRLIERTTPGASGESAGHAPEFAELREAGMDAAKKTSGPGAARPAQPAVAGELPSSGQVALGPGESAGPRGFWFEVNAELIVYGRTERDARVTVAGREVALREDGSFAFRFVLPDGEHPLPVVAVSASGEDTRGAALRFARSTRYTGEVGAHPQDPALRPPVPEAIG